MIKRLFTQKVLNLLFVLILIVLGFFLIYNQREVQKLRQEILSLTESIERLEATPQNMVNGSNGKNEPKAMDLFGFADIQKQLQGLKKQIDNVKSNGKNYSPAEQKEEENRMVSLAKDVNANVYKMASQFFENRLKTANFEESEVQAIMKTYTKSFNEIQDVQLKWLNGEILWEDMPNQLKPIYTNFYENLRRDAGEKGGKEAFDIFVPDKNLQNMLLGQ